MTTIDGGEIPFAVEARGATVRIERLRFVRPKLFAIFVDEVSGLAIESCIIEGVEPLPLPGNSSGLSSGTRNLCFHGDGTAYARNGRGTPGIFRESCRSVNNQISVSAAADHGIGIMIVNVGNMWKSRWRWTSPETQSATLRLKGINVTQIGGRARIERNTVSTSAVQPRPRWRFECRNSLRGIGVVSDCSQRHRCGGSRPAGIRIRGYPALGAAIERATITDNDVTMSAPEGAVLGVGSAGIEIMGLARGTVVQRNRIRGRARVGLSVAPDKAGTRRAIPSIGTITRLDFADAEEARKNEDLPVETRGRVCRLHMRGAVARPAGER